MIGVRTPTGVEVSAARSSPQNFQIKGRDPESGRQSPFLRQTVKQEYSSTRQRWEYVERIFDRTNNSYVERYYDSTTGAVVFEKVGRRDDQRMHGPHGKRR